MASENRTGLTVIGENINTTRRIRATSKNIVKEDGKVGYAYTDLDGTKRMLDITDLYPENEEELKTARIAHIAQAVRKQDLDYLRWAIKAQEAAGATIIDICVDEMSVYPEERMDFMRWTIKTAQSLTDASLAIDSSDPKTIEAGLEVYDRSKGGRPAINSTNLEEGRDVLIDMGRERDAIIFANGSGRSGMPENAEQRVANLTEIMGMMDKADIPMGDRFLDPLVFPIGAGPDFGNHYLDAVRTLRATYPEVHLFGGLSNVSFGLPNRKLLNHTFITLAIAAGCDAIMIDPIMNPAAEYGEFMLAANVMLARDEYAMGYLKYIRGK